MKKVEFTKFKENSLSMKEMKSINGGMNLTGRRQSTNVYDLRFLSFDYCYNKGPWGLY